MGKRSVHDARVHLYLECMHVMCLFDVYANVHYTLQSVSYKSCLSHHFQVDVVVLYSAVGGGDGDGGEAARGPVRERVGLAGGQRLPLWAMIGQLITMMVWASGQADA